MAGSSHPAFGKLLTLLLATCQLHVSSQYYFYDNRYYDSPLLVEIGLGAGLMNCLSDLGGKKGNGKRFVKDINWKNSHLAGSLFAGFLYKNLFGLRIESTLGKISAFDSILAKYSSDPAAQGRYQRNLSFRTLVFDATLSAEFYPLTLMFSGNNSPPFIEPYLLMGIGLVWYDPRTWLEGNWIKLRPLHLEGQGFAEYPARQIHSGVATCYPVGLGSRMELGHAFALRLDIVYRFTNTDYLDDVSEETYIDPGLFARYLQPEEAKLARRLYDRRRGQMPLGESADKGIRGQPGNKDGYFTFIFRAALTLGRKRRQ